MSAKEGTYALQHNHLLCDYYFVDSERLFGQDVRRIYISIIVLFALSTSISVRMCDSGSKVVRTCIGLIQGVQPEMNDVIINPSGIQDRINDQTGLVARDPYTGGGLRRVLLSVHLL